MNAALGIAYPLWLKTRWIVGGMLVYIAAMAVAIQLELFAYPGEQVVASAALLLLAMAWLLNALIFSPADLGAKGSAYPTHMLVLPLRNRALVGWPMLYAAILVTSLWLLLAILVLIPAGIPARLMLPAAILMAVTAWTQAVAFSPFPSAFARIPALVLAVLPAAALGSWPAFDRRTPSVYWLATAGSLAWTLAAYGFGVMGLSRARKGSQWQWSGWHARSRIRENSAGADSPAYDRLRRAAFRSPAAAAFWFECRRSILFLPAMLAFVAVPLLAEVSLQALGVHHSEGLMLGPLGVVQPVVLAIGVLIFTALVFGALAGATMAKPDLWSKEELPSFFATRPVTTPQMVAGKMRAAAVSAAVGWAMVALVIAAWTILESSPLNPHKSLVRQWLREASAKDLAGAALAIIALWPLTWRNMAISMCTSMTGRKWVSTTIAFAFGLAFFAAAPLIEWVVKEPERRERFIALVPWMLAVLLLEKLIGTTVVGLGLDRIGLLSRRDLARAAAWWLSVTALVFAMMSVFTGWSLYTAAAAILIVPLGRIGAAPLALHWNRCR